MLGKLSITRDGLNEGIWSRMKEVSVPLVRGGQPMTSILCSILQKCSTSDRVLGKLGVFGKAQAGW